MTYSFSQWLMCRLQGALRGASLREGRTMDGKEHLFEMVDIHGLADGSRGVVQDTVTGQVYEDRAGLRSDNQGGITMTSMNVHRVTRVVVSPKAGVYGATKWLEILLQDAHGQTMLNLAAHPDGGVGAIAPAIEVRKDETQ